MGNFKEYAEYDGLGLADLVRTKKVKSRELLEEAIERIEDLNPRLNSVVQKMYDNANKEAENNSSDGAFTGVPFLIKDLIIEYKGMPSINGCRFLKNDIADHDSEIVKRFKKAGLIITAKTNTPEFGLSVVTEPELFGTCNNPWDLTRTTGGSSGGSAASVATGIVPIAHGNDAGGSIRVPASCCGLFGLKPSKGRNPMGPKIGDKWMGIACDHVLSRSVRDSAAMLDAISGPDPGAPYFLPSPKQTFLESVSQFPKKLKIAFTLDPFMPGTVHEECKQALEKTIELCRSLGHEVIQDRPDINAMEFAKSYVTIVCSETATDIAFFEKKLNRKASHKYFEIETWAIALLGKNLKATEYLKAYRYMQKITRQTGMFFENYDLLLTPTLAMPPIKHGALKLKGMQLKILKLLGSMNAGRLLSSAAGIDALAGEIFGFAPFTALMNATGQPAMSVPLHWNKDGLPIGMQFAGKYGDETTLFRLAGQLEEVSPWFNKTPNMSNKEDLVGNVVS